MQSITIKTRSSVDFIDITREIQDAVKNIGTESGVGYVFVPHTTAAVIVNENADPSVVEDIATRLESLAPVRGNYRHGEGNAPAHIKTSLLGNSIALPVEEGRLVLGTWQGIFLCEFDGPRTRTVLVKVISG